MTDRAHIIVILAGGGAVRMGGADKGLIEWQGERLIDRIYKRLSPQEDIVISGRHDYGLSCPVVPDREDSTLKGPAAGLEAILRWMSECGLPQSGFFTVPVDGPNPPLDLTERLAGDTCAVAVDGEDYAQPTFAYWERAALTAVLASSETAPAPSLKFLAQKCAARRVIWTENHAFLNINSANDLSQQYE
ncbi:MAG: molybdenum cofactor guanylyltransferase [Maricaulaceae bacterium]